MLNVLIADDNKDFDICMVNSIRETNLNNIRIQGIATNGLEAYQKIKKLQPDIVLLDVQMPVMTGLEVIHKLSNENYNLPKILLVTAFPVLVNSFNESNLVSGVIYKPFDSSVLINYLIQLCNEYEEDKLKNKIIHTLSVFDFNTTSLGYSYLVECVKLCLENPLYLKDFKNCLYPEIAKIYHVPKASKIKWSVEKTIKSMYRYTNTPTLKKFFPNEKKLSPKFFIKEIIKCIDV